MDVFLKQLFANGVLGAILAIVMKFTQKKDNLITNQYLEEIKSGKDTENEFRQYLKEQSKDVQQLLFKNMEMQTQMMKMQAETASVLKQSLSVNKGLIEAIQQQTIYLKAMN